VSAGEHPNPMPPWWVRKWCAVFGHRSAPAGGNAHGDAGILSFRACLRCGKMLWSGFARPGM
jgi:hypothetical protein